MLKKIAFVAAFAFAAMSAFASDPVEGFWKSIDEKTGEATAFWRIYDKNGVLFGEIVRIVARATRR